ncbi:MAG: MBL fold metallo-hydrolase [Chitinispirillaceae bacterium]|jgi:7,8-dihydropterin-6-yl-methyl-4-(beta-D-ribofuranosyl)aminobenzene 5'-phosphate synthase|nr:MBL fold metallo-hydrolase [Chitinispirillaceae bacterium]
MISELSITVIVDNTAGSEKLSAEHGLSLWIEAGKTRILFDTGMGEALPHNSTALGIDIAAADAVVLSHGHYDHTGALPFVIRANPGMPVYCHPDAILPRYNRHDDGTAHSIGMPGEAQKALARAPDRTWVTGAKQIAPSLYLTGPVLRHTLFEDTGGSFFLDPALQRPDPINDDLSLWIETDGGIVVITGCCHAGIVNTVNHIAKLRPGAKIRAIIGGLHLLHASAQRLAATLDACATWSPELIVACHCTGDIAAQALTERFGNTVKNGKSGMKLTFNEIKP